MGWKSIVSKLSPGLPYLLFLGMTAPFYDYVPMWDGYQFATCLLKASSSPFVLSNYNCSAHSSAPFLLIASLFIRAGDALHFEPHSSLMLFNIVIGLLTLFSFNRILSILFTGLLNTWDRSLMTSLLAVSPVLLGATVNFNLDAGLTSFFLITFYLFLSGHLVLALISGVILAGTKETGLPLYLITLFFGVWLARPRIKAWRWITVNLLLPVGIFFGLLYYQFHSAKWVFISLNYPETRKLFGQAVLRMIELALSVDISSPAITLLLTLFVVNFQWVITAMILASALHASWIRLRRWKRLPGVLSSPWFRLSALLFLTLHFLIRYVPFSNPRYLLPAYPLLLLLLVSTILSIRGSLNSKRWVVAGLVLIQGFSCYLTFDPLSRGIFGLVRFGDREVLSLTSLNNEYFGYGRDQMVYNLQFTNLHYLLNDAYRVIKPTQNQLLVFQDDADFGLNGPIDAATYKRALKYCQGAQSLIQPFYMSLSRSRRAPVVSTGVHLFELFYVPDAAEFSSRAPAGQGNQTSLGLDRLGYGLPVHRML